MTQQGVADSRGLNRPRPGGRLWILVVFSLLGLLSWGILFFAASKGVLNCRGRPTSLVLLLRVEVAKLSLPLRCHPSLGLHHLLRLVGAAGGLVALRGVKVVQVPARGPACIVKGRHVVRARASGVGKTGICS